MSGLVALKCPNCGSFLERGQMKCQYCGAELVLLPDGSSLRFRGERTCPNCGATNEFSSWFCTNCGAVLTEDTDMLREFQSKIKFEQERTKSFLPSWMNEKIEPNEYIYFSLYWTKGGNNFYIITDKRIIKSKDGSYVDIPLSEVVGIGDPKVKVGFFLPSTSFEVNTFQGTIVFDFGDDAANCGKLCGIMRKAVANYNCRKKDVKALILSLDLGVDYSKMKVHFESQITQASRPYLKKCVQCNELIPLASEECPYCNANQISHTKR
jgi:RNA polymerase subunit RPABC4/transcription elongation factor Spt4